MKIIQISVGALSRSWLKEAEKEYHEKLKHYIPFKPIEISLKKQEMHEDPARQTEIEGKKILQHINIGDYVVLCDENGKRFTSIQFSDWMQKKMIQVPGNLVIVIGGAFGFSNDVKEKAQELISFSDMTLNHQLFRIVLLEQLYRGLSIWRNEPYHHH